MTQTEKLVLLKAMVGESDTEDLLKTTVINSTVVFLIQNKKRRVDLVKF